LLKVEASPRFERDFKKLNKSKEERVLLYSVVNDLAANKVLDPKHKDHQLKGKLKDFRECHIEKDWLLIYKKDKNRLILLLVRTGSHDDILR
jgi:mRNA interferase YafQ